MLLNGKQVHELSTICHASKVRDRAKAVVFKLKNELPRQQFAIAIQVKAPSYNINAKPRFTDKIMIKYHKNSSRIIIESGFDQSVYIFTQKGQDKTYA